MLQQTVASLLPLLPLLQQPAFCVGADGTVHSNKGASLLAPIQGQDLPLWLGSAAEFYQNWDRLSTLELPLTLMGRGYSASIQALADGTLFLLAPCEPEDSTPLSVTSQVLRTPLSELFSASRNLFDLLDDQETPTLQHHAAAVTKNLYRILRLAENLSDLDQIRSGTFRSHPQMLTVQELLAPMLTEAADAMAEAGVALKTELPDRPFQIYADPQLLQRAILNLLSNAAKYCDDGTEVSFRVELLPSAMLFQVKNHCQEDRSQLLSEAFRRMESRGFLPDPRWGVGLGLQLVRYIAQLHGGSVAMEARDDGTVTVTMSFSRKRPEQAAALEQSAPVDRLGGTDLCLVELSDILPSSAFDMDLL